MNQDIGQQQVKNFINQYLEMDIEGVIINCPYWMNKLKGGKVVVRGFTNGKGEALEIREEIIRRLQKLPPELHFPLTSSNLQKFARRERIGIDCSGFAYRVLNELIHLQYRNVQIKDLSEVFLGGINKTNTKTLTDIKYCMEVKNISEFQLGDLIRLWSGKHVAIILEVRTTQLVYVHASYLSTKTQGVHLGFIRITNKNKTLAEQDWLEETRQGENFGKKYFHPNKGDGVYRLKIFN